MFWRGEVKSRVVICHKWPLAHLFPPLKLVMVGFCYVGKEEGWGVSEYYDR